MRIVKSISFDAAHFLDHDPRERPYARMHGHSFTMDVEIAGEPDPVTGWVVDFAEVEEALNELHEQLDHRLLNDVEGLERPTLENICRWAAGKLKVKFPQLRQVRVSRPSNRETCIYDVEG
ncbi:MAG: 6-carboxytetrahydropterin synthase QueD [Marinicaulis sp.]|nr:6-carboxytetrahydropterin synthase QueD [Marinicaulis sp.]NNE40446.1 6-carboxytetrahydropterin synthase QueD [Marinicaulis sp.]NNL88547.1 6-carboxytetrahydropterin synthase QueD [Marinicaulis sp.]